LKSEERRKAIIKTSWISLTGNAFLSVLKIVIGFISGSLAVLADGVDSASDIVTSLVTLLTARLLGKKPNIRYPYGYDKADTIATTVLSFVIFFAGAQLAISAIGGVLSGEQRELPEMIAVYVTIISIIGKIILARIQLRMGKKVESSMLIANGKNMQNDVIISISVLLGLFFTFFLELPIIDSITAIIVSVYILYSAVTIFLKTNLDLMDGVDDPTVYTKAFKAVSKVKGVHRPHNMKIRKLAYRYLIAVDIEVDSGMTVRDSHDLAHRVDEEIRKEIRNVYDIIVHVEPYGGTDLDKRYGVSQEDLNENE
jgi:cation diffusion facilitator family transporter